MMMQKGNVFIITMNSRLLNYQFQIELILSQISLIRVTLRAPDPVSEAELAMQAIDDIRANR